MDKLSQQTKKYYFEDAILIRMVEETLLDLFSQGLLNGTVHTCIGQELSALAFGKQIHQNDFVFSNGEAHRMLTINVKVDGSFVGSYKSDGLIIATPTGSTAYSLSTGGPIITPSVDSLIITPTSAHTLTSRPLVVPGNSVISVEFSKADKSVLFVADGQLVDPLSIQCNIQVFRNNFSVNLIGVK